MSPGNIVLAIIKTAFTIIVTNIIPLLVLLALILGVIFLAKAIRHLDQKDDDSDEEDERR